VALKDKAIDRFFRAKGTKKASKDFMSEKSPLKPGKVVKVKQKRGRPKKRG